MVKNWAECVERGAIAQKQAEEARGLLMELEAKRCEALRIFLLLADEERAAYRALREAGRGLLTWPLLEAARKGDPEAGHTIAPGTQERMK